MATSKAHRIGIWVILVALVVGTIGGSLVLVLQTKNAEQDKARLTKLEKEYTDASTKYTKDLSDKYFETFKAYKDKNSAFDASAATKLTTEDLKVGDGEEIKSGTTQYLAYYIGWLPDGSVFDSSFDTAGTALKTPIDPSSGLIEGWTSGMNGAKIGGVRELTIPYEQAYGEQASGAIPAKTPLKFVIMAVPYTAPPQPSEEYIKLFTQSSMGGVQ